MHMELLTGPGMGVGLRRGWGWGSLNFYRESILEEKPWWSSILPVWLSGF